MEFKYLSSFNKILSSLCLLKSRVLYFVYHYYHCFGSHNLGAGDAFGEDFFRFSGAQWFIVANSVGVYDPFGE